METVSLADMYARRQAAKGPSAAQQQRQAQVKASFARSFVKSSTVLGGDPGLSAAVSEGAPHQSYAAPEARKSLAHDADKPAGGGGGGGSGGDAQVGEKRKRSRWEQ